MLFFFLAMVDQFTVYQALSMLNLVEWENSEGKDYDLEPLHDEDGRPQQRESCTVSWSKQPNASCDALFRYFVTITGNGLSMKSPFLDINTMTGQLEVFQSYTASATATSTCGSTQPIYDIQRAKYACLTSHALSLKHNDCVPVHRT